MDRIIKLSELEKAVDEVYEQFRNLDEGAVDPALTGVDTKKFGIALTLTDQLQRECWCLRYRFRGLEKT